MIEHYACGNTDFESSYLKEGKLICPKCRRELKIIGTDYRRVGKVFKCNDCGRDSSIPRITHTCQKCGTVSTWEQARLRVLYKYRINAEKKKEIDSLTGIYLPLVEFLQKGGFQVESRCSRGSLALSIHSTFKPSPRRDEHSLTWRRTESRSGKQQ